jgi:hypothetical protein
MESPVPTRPRAESNSGFGAEGGRATGFDLGASAALDSGAGNTSGEANFDLTLRVLTILVIGGLVGSASLLVYLWVAPRFAQNDAGPVTITTAQPRPKSSAAAPGAAHGDEVLMDPGHVFRCEEQGRVTFSDQACTGSGAAGSGPGVNAGATERGQRPTAGR